MRSLDSARHATWSGYRGGLLVTSLLRPCYTVHVERVARVFDNFADADNADEQHYAQLSSVERIDILLDLIERYQECHGQAAARFERVYRVVELGRG